MTPNRPLVVCGFCRRMFEPAHRHHRFCSPFCQAAAQNVVEAPSTLREPQSSDPNESGIREPPQAECSHNEGGGWIDGSREFDGADGW